MEKFGNTLEIQTRRAFLKGSWNSEDTNLIYLHFSVTFSPVLTRHNEYMLRVVLFR